MVMLWSRQWHTRAGDWRLASMNIRVQRVYQVTEAVRRTVESERTYILSLGSQQGNRHVHWHIAPAPFGLPFKEQQLEALRTANGVLEIPDDEMAKLANRIRWNMKLDDL
jgi:diadenosine tetraphosphate (Ap4A) HIT family hydrolase